MSLLRPAFLDLIRWKNLLILGSCILSFHFLLQRISDPVGLAPRMQGLAVLLLILSLNSLTAAGYLINAIKDQNTDAINHPHRRWIPDRFAASRVWTWYYLALGLGFVPAAWLAYHMDLMAWLWLYPLVAWLLHRYSTAWKGRGVLGNILVALLSGAVPLLLLIPEQDLLQALPSGSLRQLWFLFIGFAGFAFLASVFRELVKDLEDLPGDQAAGWKTFAVRAGPQRAVHLAIGLGSLTALSLLVGAAVYPGGSMVSGGLILLGIFQAVLVRQLLNRPRATDLSRVSQWTRWLMAAGLALIWLAP